MLESCTGMGTTGYYRGSGVKLHDEHRANCGDGDSIHGNTAVMGLNFVTNTALTAGMGTVFTVIPR